MYNLYMALIIGMYIHSNILQVFFKFHKHYANYTSNMADIAVTITYIFYISNIGMYASIRSKIIVDVLIMYKSKSISKLF